MEIYKPNGTIIEIDETYQFKMDDRILLETADVNSGLRRVVGSGALVIGTMYGENYFEINTVVSCIRADNALVKNIQFISPILRVDETTWVDVDGNYTTEDAEGAVTEFAYIKDIFENKPYLLLPTLFYGIKRAEVLGNRFQQ